jgi:hypothetical protein
MVAEAGVGEWIIPMDGSERSKEMWEDAGQMLGMDLENTGGGGDLQPSNATSGSSQSDTKASVEKTININLNGSGNVKISGSGASKEQIVEVMLENLKEVFMNIVEQEILEEGVGVYEY